MRELGLPARSARPGAVPDIIAAQVEVILEERPAVFSIGLGDPGPDLVDRCRAQGIKVVAMVATVEDARAVVDVGGRRGRRPG